MLLLWFVYAVTFNICFVSALACNMWVCACLYESWWGLNLYDSDMIRTNASAVTCLCCDVWHMSECVFIKELTRNELWLRSDQSVASAWPALVVTCSMWVQSLKAWWGTVFARAVSRIGILNKLLGGCMIMLGGAWLCWAVHDYAWLCWAGAWLYYTLQQYVWVYIIYNIYISNI